MASYPGGFFPGAHCARHPQPRIQPFSLADGVGNSEGSREMEGATLAVRTFHPDPASHHFYQLAADGQSQARTAKAAGGGAINLGEGLEDVCLFLGGNADAGVLHAEVKSNGLFLSRTPVGPAG